MKCIITFVIYIYVQCVILELLPAFIYWNFQVFLWLIKLFHFIEQPDWRHKVSFLRRGHTDTSSIIIENPFCVSSIRYIFRLVNRLRHGIFRPWKFQFWCVTRFVFMFWEILYSGVTHLTVGFENNEIAKFY